MSRPTRDAIQEYMSITGAIEPVALQRLEEHGGNLAEAVNAHFGEFENNITSPTSGASTRYDFVEDNRQHRDRDSRQGGRTSLISAARGFMPSFLLDPGYRKNILRQIGGSVFAGRSPRGSHTGEVTGFHADDYARSSSSHGSQIRGDTNGDHGSYLYDDNAEEEMIQAAIEASKKDSQDPSKILSPEEVSQLEEEELACALSLSLKTEELENAIREQIAELQPYHVEDYDMCTSDTNENGRSKPGSSLVQRTAEDVKQKQTDNRSGHERHLCHIEEACNPKELGLIPSEELDKALMLEAELSNGMARNSSHDHLRGRHSKGQSSKNMELERASALKESFIPAEPSLEHEDAVTLLVRMPDSSRHGRRFLKSDKLKHLFYFIDSCRAVETGKYKVVRPYPRHAFSREDGALTFEELGLTNKQEALFLELI